MSNFLIMNLLANRSISVVGGLHVCPLSTCLLVAKSYAPHPTHVSKHLFLKPGWGWSIQYPVGPSAYFSSSTELLVRCIWELLSSVCMLSVLEFCPILVSDNVVAPTELKGNLIL